MLNAELNTECDLLDAGVNARAPVHRLSVDFVGCCDATTQQLRNIIWSLISHLIGNIMTFDYIISIIKASAQNGRHFVLDELIRLFLLQNWSLSFSCFSVKIWPFRRFVRVESSFFMVATDGYRWNFQNSWRATQWTMWALFKQFNSFQF